ncbi:expressed unknown protein [Seminavis robusta]|uniref:Uncharacterized protein n=1 Tax=Seminavis robusta TaxID=568900 RepID=A0A9N8HH48_9STRA|nr:expressed unknown protein [Seminavis robusta]|eukprot:Sro543_g163450.1 n/a (277) ;mRNA; f:10042-10872
MLRSRTDSVLATKNKNEDRALLKNTDTHTWFDIMGIYPSPVVFALLLVLPLVSCFSQYPGSIRDTRALSAVIRSKNTAISRKDSCKRLLVASSNSNHRNHQPYTNNNHHHVVASILLPIAIFWATSLPAAATADSALSTNDYTDPLHPQCQRHIEVNADGETLRYSGTTVVGDGRGCSPKEAKAVGGIRRFVYEGTLDGNNNKMIVSLGDGSHTQGVWESDGIRWQDGSKWMVQEKTLAVKAGEVITFSYIGFSLLAGVKGVYNVAQKKKEESALK